MTAAVLEHFADIYFVISYDFAHEFSRFIGQLWEAATEVITAIAYDLIDILDNNFSREYYLDGCVLWY